MEHLELRVCLLWRFKRGPGVTFAFSSSSVQCSLASQTQEAQTVLLFRRAHSTRHTSTPSWRKLAFTDFAKSLMIKDKIFFCMQYVDYSPSCWFVSVLVCDICRCCGVTFIYTASRHRFFFFYVYILLNSKKEPLSTVWKSSNNKDLDLGFHTSKYINSSVNRKLELF